MIKCPKVTKWRRQLFENCDDFVNQIVESDLTISVSTPDTPQYHKIIISNQIDYIHGRIIQEWYFFLNCIFKEAVLYYLQNGYPSEFPSINLNKFNLKKLKPTRRLTRMRDNICSVAKESFSFLPYDQRINIIKKLFNTNEIQSYIKNEMKKHVVIRNIFEHNRGEVRESDLAKVGQPAGGCFEIVDDEGKIVECRRGDTIILSKAEIQKLNKIIKVYSKRLAYLA